MVSLLAIPVVGEVGGQIILGVGGMSSAGGFLVASEQGDTAGMFGNAIGLLGVGMSTVPSLSSTGFGTRVGEGVLIRGSQVGDAMGGVATGFGLLTHFTDPPGYSTDPRGRLNQYRREQGRIKTP